MTSVSNANSSSYDPNAQFSSADGCDPSIATCGPTETPPAREVTIAPVVIQGDAGAQQLVKQLDASRNAPNCSLEGLNAAVSCGKAGAAAAGTALLTTTVIGAAIGAAGTFLEAVSCGKDLRAYYDCKTQ